MEKEEKKRLKAIHAKISRKERLTPEEQRLFDKEYEEFKDFDYPGKTERLSKIAIAIAAISILLTLLRLLFPTG